MKVFRQFNPITGMQQITLVPSMSDEMFFTMEEQVKSTKDLKEKAPVIYNYLKNHL